MNLTSDSSIKKCERFCFFDGRFFFSQNPGGKTNCTIGFQVGREEMVCDYKEKKPPPFGRTICLLRSKLMNRFLVIHI